MMKIKGYITYLPALLSLLLWSCADDTLDAPGYGKEGEPAKISLKVEVPDMGEATSRAMMSDTETSQVNDLWIGIYNAATGERTFSNFYERDHHDNIHLWWQIDDIATKSGRSYIVAVANSRTNFGVSGKSGLLTPLDELLESADTWDSYKNISVSLPEPGSVDRYTSDFPMSGIYYDNNSQTAHPSGDDGWVEANQTPSFIPDGNVGLMPGYIHLRRLHSYARFNIKAASNINVEPMSWRVVNVPTISYVHEQSRNSADAADYKDAAVASTQEFSTFEKDGNGTFFDFYQLENKHIGLAAVNSYDDREKEFKNSDGTNTGVYASLCPSVNETADNSASLVEIKAKVTYNVDAQGNPTTDANGTPRIGFAKYTIHLGYCEGAGAQRARDFRHRRNTKYTYNVTVKGLDKIVVEAEKDGEKQPGAEGDVTDMEKEMVEVDCHYTLLNIKLSNKERNEFQWRIQCPYDNNTVNLCSYFLTGEERQGLNNNLFYTWVRILPAENATTPARYTPEAWYIEDLRDVTGHPHHTGDTDTENTQERWYTVFIDENTYALDASGRKIDDSQWAQSAWQKYVNKPNRNVWLGLDFISESPDVESTYSKAKYLISQKSIQTYYAAGKSQAIGVEHRNETFGKNLLWFWHVQRDALSYRNGRYNMWKYINEVAGYEWEHVANTAKFCTFEPINEQGYHRTESGLEHIIDPFYLDAAPWPTHPQPDSRDIYQIITACMSRNRDLNGDGKISTDEVRWYLPTVDVYMEMVMGADALSNPLMNFEDVPELVYPSRDDNWYKSTYRFTRFHFASSDLQYLWAEEGMSTAYNYWNTETNYEPNRGLWELRCVRNLGTDIKNEPSFSQSDVADIFTIDKNSRTITTLGLNSRALRSSTATYIKGHIINDPMNRLARKFEYAEEDCKWNVNVFDDNIACYLTDEGNFDFNYEYNPERYASWFKAASMNGVCRYYTQNADRSDLGTWRAPNQRELAVMWNLGVFADETVWRKWYSVTREYYNQNDDNMQRPMGVTPWVVTAGYPDFTPRVRCVRDVIR